MQVRRLVALGVGIIVVVLLLVLVARSCSGSSAESQNAAYLTQVKRVLAVSDAAGAKLHAILHGKPARLATLLVQLRAGQVEAQKALTEAEALKTTRQLEAVHPYLLQALSYRVAGLKCMTAAFPQAFGSRRPVAAGALLTPCTARLLASDVIYADSFAAGASTALSNAGITLQVPTSAFLTPGDHSYLTAAGIGLAVQRLKPGVTRHGLHGLSLDTVIVQPGGQTLRPGGVVNQVKVSDNLKFVITATNGGQFQEVNIPVVLTLGTGSSKVTKTATIDQIAPGATATVEITHVITGSSQLSSRTTLTVLVTPVPGERTTSNNKLTYTIAFSLA
ncbi:MAG: hypothetical protein ACXVYV_00420 [Gaiellales bacterium]